MKVLFFTAVFLILLSFGAARAQIDRQALVGRHAVVVEAVDTLASLTVGNGAFAFTVDATGLQTFPEYYSNGIPLGTLSDWGWDTSPNPRQLRFAETLTPIRQYGREVLYSLQAEQPERKKQAVDWYRANPHRVQLGIIGLELLKKDGSLAAPGDLKDLRQRLDLWTGEIVSVFSLEGTPVCIRTGSHQQLDAVGAQISSALLEEGRLKVRLRIPFPTAGWSDKGILWKAYKEHSSSLKSIGEDGALVEHQMDSLKYGIGISWEGRGKMEKRGSHEFVLQPDSTSSFAFSMLFAPGIPASVPGTEAILASSRDGWAQFWMSGGAVDFTGSTDSRATELERRVVLSQYLTRVQCAGENPPQETGLTYNSWYGRPHLEMHWWHGLHFALWGRPEYLEKSMGWYGRNLPKGREIARRQGFNGARWPKMTDPAGNDSPSSIGAFLIWQQPHIISFAELLYRANPQPETLVKYKELVYATADFMASFAHYKSEKKRYELGPGIIPAQERFQPLETFNPSFELAYWKWALDTALSWKVRAGENVPPLWKRVALGLSPLPVGEGKYLAAESAPDSYSRPEFRTDHPSVLGAFGMLPQTSLLNTEIMAKTFEWVWEHWAWEETWGWDFPMAAMTAARLGKKEMAIDALLKDASTNTYLPNGHNYQNKRLTLYLPGNGGLLAAVGMMCAGWDGSAQNNPGFPEDGSWKVRWEGLLPMY